MTSLELPKVRSMRGRRPRAARGLGTGPDINRPSRQKWSRHRERRPDLAYIGAFMGPVEGLNTIIASKHFNPALVFMGINGTQLSCREAADMGQQL